MKKKRSLLMILIGALLFLGGLTGFIMTLRASLAEVGTNTLYGAIAADPLTAVYEGEHQDSLDGSGNEAIHYFTGSDEIVNHNNVKLGDTCWQVLRTTDTGGVKMIYNGPYDETNKCNSSRGTHKGIINTKGETTDLSGGAYLYGYGFTYNESTGEFTLINPISATWSSSTYKSLEGKYTCMSTSDTCTTIYNIHSYSSDTSAKTTSYTIDDTHYSQIGTSPFNINSNLAMGGYMTNSSYSTTATSYTAQTEQVLQQSSSLFTNSYYYGSSIKTNGSLYNIGGTISRNPGAGLYTVLSSSLYGSTAYYIVGKSGSVFYYLTLTGGKSLAATEKYYTYGDSYTGNTITNPSSLTSTNFFSRHNSLRNKFYCSGATSTASCTLKYATNTTPATISYISAGSTKYGNKVTYANGKYTLVSVVTGFPDKNHHYTCNSGATTCETAYYVNYFNANTIRRITLTGGKNINNVIEEMYDSNSVNHYNSSIKSQIEGWYRAKLANYTKYFEDAVYCNDRTRANQSASGFGPSGGNLSRPLYFSDRDGNTTLKCTNLTDQFAVGNTKAKNKFPVGLPTSAEMNLLDNDAARTTGESYWLGSPYAASIYASNGYINNEGSVISYNTGEPRGTRPVVSLKAGTKYISGTGSQTDPYVIDIRPVITTSVKHGTITETDQVEEGSNKTISYSPDSGYQLKSIKVDGEEVSITTYANSYTFNNITEDHAIEVEYWKPTITTSVIHGTITETSDVDSGEDKTISYSPDSGYELKKITVDGVDVSISAHASSYTFTNVTEDHSIEVEYWKPTITTSVIHGTITETSDVDSGEDKTINYSPDTGYRLESIKVDGVEASITAYPNSYTFNNVTEDHTIEVVYVNKKVGYIVNYLENETDKVLHTQKREENAYYGDEIISIQEMIDIVNYHFVDFNKERIVLEENINDNVINLYYEKNSKEDVITDHSMVLTSEKAKITSEEDKVDYQIKYRVGLENYVGKVKAKITAYLPYQIDPDESELDGGKYNKDYRTITWEGTVDIDKENNQISFDKDIELVYKGYDLSKNELINVVAGEITLKDLDDYTEEVYDTKTTSVDIKKDVKPDVKPDDKGTNNKDKSNSTNKTNKIVEDRVKSPNTTTRNMYLYIIVMMISIVCFILGIKNYKQIKS